MMTKTTANRLKVKNECTTKLNVSERLTHVRVSKIILFIYCIILVLKLDTWTLHICHNAVYQILILRCVQ